MIERPRNVHDCIASDMMLHELELSSAAAERETAARAMRPVSSPFMVKQTESAGFQHGYFLATLDLLRCAVILTDASGRIRHTNRRAAAMLGDGSFVQNSRNILRATHAAARHEIAQAIRLATSDDHAPPARTLTVNLARDGSSPVVAHVLPLSQAGHPAERDCAQLAAIFICDLDDNSGCANVVAAFYQLTPAEAEVLRMLIAGHDLAEAARQLGIALTTVRTHLRAIFRKTGVNRQSQLLLLAAQLNFPVSRT